MTRWRIGEASPIPLDIAPPGKPVFGLHKTGQGSVELMGIGFEELVNTRTISAGTLTLHYWPELSSPSQVELSQPMGAEDTLVSLSAAGGAEPGSLIQIDAEVLAVAEVLDGGTQYQVTRGVQGRMAESHPQGTAVFHLTHKVYILPFPRDFFGSPSSGNHSFPIYLPDARIAAAELVVTNMRGNSEASQVSFTSSTDYGLRTLSGGQFSIQVQGYPGIQSNLAPPLVIETSHAVRDIFAVLFEAPSGGPMELRVRQNDETYCQLTIPADQKLSNVVDGFNLPPLAAGAKINVDVLSVPSAGAGFPGRDLTVTIRL